jgi:hypothetical protein
MSDQIPVRPTLYRLTVYAPGKHTGAHFMSKTPFQPMNKGDRVVAGTWIGTESEFPAEQQTFVVAEVSEVIRCVQLQDGENVDVTLVYTDALPPSPR